MSNMASAIKGHYKKALRDEQATDPGYSCRKKNECPLNGQCLTNNVIYQAKVSTPSSEPKIYIGLAESEFKTSYNNHKLSFKNRKYASKTALSNYVWDLKQKQLNSIIQLNGAFLNVPVDAEAVHHTTAHA